MNGNEKPKPSPGIGMNLKLYKKPKPGQPPAEPAEKIDGPLNFLEQVEQEEFRSKYETPRPATQTGNGKKGTYITLGLLLALLAGLLVYFTYEPPAPDVQGPRERTNLLPACQQGNGVACGELALLEYLGLERLEGLPGEKTPAPNNAFIYARLSCARGSAFGCYMIWRLWTKKELKLLDTAAAEETLKKGCALKGPLPCLLKDRFAGKRDIAPDELRKAITDAADGKKPPRYSNDTAEQRLYTHFLATEQ